MVADRIDSKPRGLGAPTGPDHQTVVRYTAQSGRDIVVRNGLGEDKRLRPTRLHIVARPGEVDLKKGGLTPVFNAKIDSQTIPTVDGIIPGSPLEPLPGEPGF